MLILPGNPLFSETLDHFIPPDSRQLAEKEGGMYLAASPETGLLVPRTQQGMIDYVLGGEYDERLTQLEDDEQDPTEYDDNSETNNFLSSLVIF
jgi:hypothetical protein